MRHKASVVIPAYNGAKYIGRAIESCLGQETTELEPEVIVIDDASTDKTLHVLETFGDRVRAVALGRNVGRCNARNEGLDRSTGAFVKFLDQDDFLEPGSLAPEVVMAEREGADIVVSRSRSVVFRPDGTLATVATYEAPEMRPIVDALLAGKAVPTAAALYRRSYVTGLSWDPAIRKLDDWDWFVRAALRMGRIVAVPHTSYAWVHHGAQWSRHAGGLVNARDFYAILDKLEGHLRDTGQLTASRKRRLAQYLYKELQLLFVEDPADFASRLRHIYDLDPSFQPRDEEQRPWVRWLARAFGVAGAFRIHLAFRSLYRTVRRGIPAKSVSHPVD
jgi:glycosyltransferase involved in cell wall biosynthesis